MTIARVSGWREQNFLISPGDITIKAVESASAVAASRAETQAAFFSLTGWAVRGSIMCRPFFRPEALNDLLQRGLVASRQVARLAQFTTQGAKHGLLKKRVARVLQPAKVLRAF